MQQRSDYFPFYDATDRVARYPATTIHVCIETTVQGGSENSAFTVISLGAAHCG